MSLLANPVLIAPSGEPAEPKNFADSPVAGQYLRIAAGARTWEWGAGGSFSPIGQTMVVDATLGSAAGTGSLGAPYQTIQQAINRAVALGWTQVQVLTAPGTYAGAIAIPNGLAVEIHGWDADAPALLGGDITITGGIGSFDLVSFTNCQITAANIATAAAGQDIGLQFRNCANAAIVAGFNVFIWLQQSSQDGNVVAGGGTFISYDGFSWARTLQSAPVLPAGYTRQFLDAGHDVYQRALTALAVPVFPAVGSTVFVTMAISTGAFVRTTDHADIKVVNPAVQDFLCGIHGVGPGNVTAWLTNLSRNGGGGTGDFNEAIEVIMHHADMIAEPPP